MPSFSQRHGYSPVEQAFQRESVNSTLKVSLWNVLKLRIWDRWESYNYGYTHESERINSLMERMWVQYFKWDIDGLPSFEGRGQGTGAYAKMKEVFLQSEWYKVYDFIEFLAKDKDTFIDNEVRSALNAVLERENSAYRLAGKEITEVTDKTRSRRSTMPSSTPRWRCDSTWKPCCAC
jgi:hypothetical protein